MSDIVETVGRAICASEQDDYMEFCQQYDRMAKAAIRATIGDMDENISEGMVRAGKEELALSRANGDHPDAQIANTFRAMLCARLKELEA